MVAVYYISVIMLMAVTAMMILTAVLSYIVLRATHAVSDLG